jgi:membrane protein required for colicin V production
MDAAPVNITDIAVALVILFSGVFAFFRGFVHEILAVVSWIGAAVATLIGFPFALPQVQKVIAIPLVAELTTGILLFLIVLVLLSIATRILARKVQGSALGPLDRSLGLLFGFLRGAVLVCVAWLVLVWVLPREDHPGWLAQARSLPLVERGGALLVGLLPERFRGEVVPATAPENGGATGSATQSTFQSLVSPAPKGDAPAAEPSYNARMRDEMQRAVEAATQGGTQAETPPE